MTIATPKEGSTMTDTQTAQPPVHPTTSPLGPSSLPSWIVTVGSMVAAGMTAAGEGHLSTPVVAVVNAVAGLLLILHIHVALPRAASGTASKLAQVAKAILE